MWGWTDPIISSFLDDSVVPTHVGVDLYLLHLDYTILVVPTHVGVDLLINIAIIALLGCPHTCGGGPAESILGVLDM